MSVPISTRKNNEGDTILHIASRDGSADLVETSARIGCLDKKECRAFLDCTDKGGDIFQGSLDSDSKDARAQDSIGDGATVSLSASDIKTITGAREKEREIAPCAAGKARIRLHVGESDTPFVNFGCLAPEGERCTNAKLECTEDSDRDWPAIKAETIDRLNVRTVSTLAGADHRIAADRGWHSRAIESDGPFYGPCDPSLDQGGFAIDMEWTAVSPLHGKPCIRTVFWMLRRRDAIPRRVGAHRADDGRDFVSEPVSLIGHRRKWMGPSCDVRAMIRPYRRRNIESGASVNGSAVAIFEWRDFRRASVRTRERLNRSTSENQAGIRYGREALIHRGRLILESRRPFFASFIGSLARNRALIPSQDLARGNEVAA